MDLIKSISFYIVTSVALNLLAKGLGSDFIGPFIKGNIISILINLLAINIATCTILMTKLNEIKSNATVDFSATYRELKLSLKEQVILIATSFLILMLDKSTLLNMNIPHCTLCFDIVLTAIFIYAVDILWDLGKAVFAIINYN